MNMINSALRRPITVLVAVIGIIMGCYLAIQRMQVDIFPALNLPVIYVCQPYGGMDPAQMEGYLTNYYEYHFLYINGIHHVESRNVQGASLMKLHFHPGTDMAQAMAETINYINRSRAFMPPGTVSPFVMRFDTGSVPVGYLVCSSDTRTVNEIQDLALFHVRPMFSSLPGVSAPPPFGGSQRSIVVTVDPQRLRSYGMSPEEVVTALTKGNVLTPSGNIALGDQYPIVPVNSIVRDVQELENVPVRDGVYIRDLGYVQDTADATVGYALVNGRRAVYILVTKRASASTVAVVNEVRNALPKMQAVLPDDIKVSFEFDQSPYVTRAVEGVAMEGALGAVLVGLMVLLFLRDWRSALVIVLNIPLALAAAVIALWVTGYTINLMTLGGLALAIGILVDEATVAIENIHTHMARGKSLARAVKDGSAETAVPRLLAMLCILAVFIPAFFMQGAAGGLFVPLALAVGFSMIASYILSSTLVPVLCMWLLRHKRGHVEGQVHEKPSLFRRGYEGVMAQVVKAHALIVIAYLLLAGGAIYFVGQQLGTEIFPDLNAKQFRMRLLAPDGTHIERSEEITKQALQIVEDTVGKENVEMTVGYVGGIHSSYPVNAVFQWSRGPEEAIIRIGLKQTADVDVEQLQETLRDKFAEALPGVRASFEPSDIISEVMSFGSPTPLEVAVTGKSLDDNRAYAEKVYAELSKIESLRDLQYAQSLEYPTVEVDVDRVKAGLNGLTVADVARAIVPATSSSRFIVPNYWADPKSGIGYQIQVEVPRSVLRDPSGIDSISSVAELASLPVKREGDTPLLLRDVADITRGTMPGQYDRYNMRRQVSMTANVVGQDLGSFAKDVEAAMKRAGDPPRGAEVVVRGQIPVMTEMLDGLTVGLGLAVVVIFLLLAANFQSIKLSLITVAAAPGAIAGVVIMLYLTGTTMNIQSFIGAIMAIGVAMANAILLVTFAERDRKAGASAKLAAVSGAGSRLRPILMTTCAMMAGMLPMALAMGEAGQQNAPLGRAVIGGLIGATIATLLVLPSVFALVQGWAHTRSASLDPDDPHSPHYAVEPA